MTQVDEKQANIEENKMEEYSPSNSSNIRSKPYTDLYAAQSLVHLGRERVSINEQHHE